MRCKGGLEEFLCKVTLPDLAPEDGLNWFLAVGDGMWHQQHDHIQNLVAGPTWDILYRLQATETNFEEKKGYLYLSIVIILTDKAINLWKLYMALLT